MADRLPIWRTPKFDQSMDSFICDLGEGNYYSGMGWLNKYLGVEKFHDLNYLYECDPIQMLAKFTGLSEKQIQNLTMGRFLPSIRFAGKRPQKKYLNEPFTQGEINYFVSGSGEKQKICPICIMEDEYSRLSWKLLYVTACLKHQVVLNDICSGCGEKLAINDLKCKKCGLGINELDVVELSSDEFELNMVADIYSSFGLSENLIQYSFPKISPNRFLELLQGLANLLLIYDQENPYFSGFSLEIGKKKILRSQSNIFIHNAFCAAYHALQNWPTNWKIMLSRIAGEAYAYRELAREFPDRYSKRQSFVYRLKKLSGSTQCFWLWETTLVYIEERSAQNQKYFYWWKQLRKESKFQRISEKNIDIYQASFELGVGIDTLKWFVSNKLLRVNTGILEVDHHQWLFEKEQIKEFWRKYSVIKNASKILSVAETTFRDWIKNEWIDPVVIPDVSGKGQYLFDVEYLKYWRAERMVSSEVREYLAISARTLEMWVSKGKLEPIKNFQIRPSWFWKNDVKKALQNSPIRTSWLLKKLNQYMVNIEGVWPISVTDPPIPKLYLNAGFMFQGETRPEKIPEFDILNGVLHLMRTGKPLSQLPERYPSRAVIRRAMLYWYKNNVFSDIANAVNIDCQANTDKIYVK